MMCQIPLQEKTGNEAEACGRPAETEKKRGAIINRSIEKHNLYVLCDIERALLFGMYGEKKKKKSRERTDANTNNTAESPASHWSDGDVSSSHKVTPPEC